MAEWCIRWYNKKKSCNCFWWHLQHYECKLSLCTVKNTLVVFLWSFASCNICTHTHIHSNKHTPIHTDSHTNLLGEIVKWWNASSFHGSLNPHLSSHPPSSSTVPPSLMFLSLSLPPPTPCSHFCKLAQLIESQWCENMVLWQRVCQGARSSLSLFKIIKIYVRID